MVEALSDTGTRSAGGAGFGTRERGVRFGGVGARIVRLVGWAVNGFGFLRRADSG